MKKIYHLVAIVSVILMSCSKNDSLSLELESYHEGHELPPYERPNYISEWASNIAHSESNCADSLLFLSELDVLVLECDSFFERAHYSYTGDTLKIQILEPVWDQDDVGRMDTISEWTLVKHDEELTMASIKNKKDNKWIEVPAEGYDSNRRFKKLK
ncbi:hypothetical protein [Pontibacter ruber]|uniref:Lipoprotein n=1 Tax=Pontibacter ruber TaxID=1343895 RepID=A0ABW5D1A7_9BACT|nr:hypothetical protein [Pontibacter ruber]